MGENGEFHNTSGPGWEGLGPSPAKDSKQQSERQARVFINGKCQSEISSAASLTSCLLYGDCARAQMGGRGGKERRLGPRSCGTPVRVAR